MKGFLFTAWLFSLGTISVDAHSWIEKVESIYGEGSSRIGMPNKSDSYLQRYFCPLSSLDECQPDPKHNIVLDENALRPCRADKVSNPKATVKPGTDLTLHWAGNGHVGNGQSDGTCVTVKVAPFEADPSLSLFSGIDGAECLDFWITAEDGSQQPQGTIKIPDILAQGSYTLLWYWNFTEFWYSSCIDILVDEGLPTASPTKSELHDDTVQDYLHNGCADIADSTQFCQKYTTIPESYCMTEKDECGRSICYGVADFLFPCPLCPPGCPVPKAFYDDFSNGLDETKWLIAHKSWGGGKNGFTNGGVVAENVIADASAGTVTFKAHGNFYSGDVMGINKDLTRQTTGVRTGGAIATRQYLGAGSYEVKMKTAGKPGVCSAIWTFFYNDDEYYSGQPIQNHEIDIELPGRPGPAAVDFDFSQALLNTWTGEIESLYETGYTTLPKAVDDEAFHIWRFDWHTDPNDRRVDFYLDGEYLRTMRNDNIPFYAGRLWLGAWFPNAWAGIPEFAEEEMVIDYVKFTPFNELYDCPPESYPDFGWAPGIDFTLGQEHETCNSVPSSPVSSPVSSPISVPSSPVSSPISPPFSSPVSSPVSGPSPTDATLYFEHGCKDLPAAFCQGYISGSYCKDWNEDSCGRSICQGDTHDSLNSCGSETSIYFSDGCNVFGDQMDTFCGSYNQGYCKSWQHDSCGRSICHGDDYSVLDGCEEGPIDFVEVYKNDGCASLPSTFCSGYNGNYCKDYKTDSCGRSVCHGDSFSSLNSC